jgi:GMP synthase (glutamine-hydrolysing)
VPVSSHRSRITLIQLRRHNAALHQERECFATACRIPTPALRCINLVDTPRIGWAHVVDAQAVLIGGAGDFSVTEEHSFTPWMRDVLLRLVEEQRPVFGSCWGHQFLASTLGGDVITDPEREEVGCFEARLAGTADRDPVFAGLPDRFHVNLGHKDRVSRLVDGWTSLAATDRCPNQAIRFGEGPFYGTQFHPELDERRLLERLEIYAEAYVPDPEEQERVRRGLRPTPEAEVIVDRFLKAFVD